MKYAGETVDGYPIYQCFTTFFWGFGGHIAVELAKSPTLAAITNPKNKGRFRVITSIILFNCYQIMELEKTCNCIFYKAYARGKSGFKMRYGKYGQIQFSNRDFVAVVDALHIAGYLGKKKGFHDSSTGYGLLSAYFPMPVMRKLLLDKRDELLKHEVCYSNHQPIQLRNLKKENVDIPNMPYEIWEARDEVLAYNKFLYQSRIRIEFPEQMLQFDFLPIQHIDKLSLYDRRTFLKELNGYINIVACKDTLNPRQRISEGRVVWDIAPIFYFYSRIFSRESWDLGGRYYSLLTTVPKTLRKFMLLDGEPLEEVDYKGLHIRLLYAACEIDYDADPYAIPLPGLTPDESRATVKKALLALINAEDEKEAISALQGEFNHHKLEQGDLKAAIIMEVIIKYHSPISQYFCTDAGLELQRIDSEIMSKVIKRALAKNIPMLPLHDALLCHQRDTETIKEIMEEEYEEEIGYPGRVDIKIA